ncbi:NAD-dependent malic enzyme [Ceratocystis fimbriata CBS 114723]|uniref:NAD-dependent malic enzyme n=1 Tax=Ceratocystis fimbriata CBS 114723 TaxID=1035309 RepID=A0A2C5X1D4_9PEZI|nr:NAD-dependent malic enzyme [Ceratocystis fimbriata CBS 114723]
MASCSFSASSTSNISTPRSHSPCLSASTTDVASAPDSQFVPGPSSPSLSSSSPSLPSSRAPASTAHDSTTNQATMSSFTNVSAIEQAMQMSSLDQFKGYVQATFPEVQQANVTQYSTEAEASGYQILREPVWNKALSLSYSSSRFISSSAVHSRPPAAAAATISSSMFPPTPPPLSSSPSSTMSSPSSDSQSPLAMSDRKLILGQGLSFTPEERINKNLTGLIPHTMESLSTQCARAMKMIHTRQTPIDKYLYLSSIKDQNVDLFYRLLMNHVRELMPLVYTPTIGDVCLQYSTLYTRPEALYISIKQRKSIRTILKNWPYPNPEICVVTDGSRILGLGDLGVNGVGISIGKLSLYTAAAGIHPSKTLPIVLDCGTNNETNLKDPFYLGMREKRPSVQVQQDFMDEFMEAAREVYPEMVVQFEDFESEKAFNYLDRYRDSYKCFNDDIQGTGAVVLGGYIGAVNLSGVPIEEQRLVFMGAGSAGVGVAKQLVEYYTRRGLTEAEARDKFWLVDTKGLVTKDRGDKLASHKVYFARTDNEGQQYRTLEEVIEYVQPTALVGLTATFGVFTESVVRALKKSVDAGGKGRRPILFPLSNPLTKAECTFEQAVNWTDGTVIFASGSPFSSFSVKTANDNVITYHPNQGNNVYVFPGIGLGAILAKASKVTDDMIYTAAAALSESLNADEIHKGLIYPEIERVRDASIVVAREVMKAARRDGVSELSEAQWAEFEEWGDVSLTAYIESKIYNPTSFGESHL